MRACSGGTPNTIARSRRGLTAPPAPAWQVCIPLAGSYSPTAARGSIGTPATRCTQVSNFTICAAVANAASAASLSPTSPSRMMFGKSSRARGASCSAAARPRATEGSTCQSISTSSAASLASATLSATTTATISPTWQISGKVIGWCRGRTVGEPSLFLIAMSAGWLLLICGRGLSPSARTSSEVSTHASTPDAAIARAASVELADQQACAYGERTNTA